MNRRVNRKLLDQWLQEHGPGGVSRLAVASNISASTIEKCRATEMAPKKLSTLQRLSEAVGLDLEKLFPKCKAS